MADKYLEFGTTGFPEENEAAAASLGVSDAGRLVALDDTGRIDESMLPVKPEKPAIDFLKIRVSADGTGTPTAKFNYYVAAGNKITCPELATGFLIYAMVNVITYQDFTDTPQVTQNGAELDFTAMGGLFAGDWLIICYKTGT